MPSGRKWICLWVVLVENGYIIEFKGSPSPKAKTPGSWNFRGFSGWRILQQPVNGVFANLGAILSLPRRIRTRLHVNHGRGVAFYGLDPYPAIGSRLALRALGATAGILRSATERPQGRDRGGVGLDP